MSKTPPARTIRENVKRNVKRLIVLHCAGLAAVVILLFESLFIGRIAAEGSPFFVNEKSAFGASLFTFVRPAGHHLSAVEFNVAGEKARSLNIYFSDAEDRYLSLKSDSGGCLKITGSLASVVEAPRCIDRPLHLYRWTFGDYTAMLEDAGTILWQGPAITGDLDLSVRRGPRNQSARQFPPMTFRVTTTDTASGKSIAHKISPARVTFNLLSAGALIFFIFVFLPALPLAAAKTPKAMLGAEILLIVVLPLWPSLGWEKTLTDQGLWSKSDLHYDASTKTLRFQGLSAKSDDRAPSILFIGGSACAGVPYGRENSMAAIMERLAAENGIAAKAHNFGQVSWSMETWLRVLPRIEQAMKPAVTVAYLNFNSLIMESLRMPEAVFINLLYFRPYQRLPARVSFDAARLPEIFDRYERADHAVRSVGGRFFVLDDPVSASYLFADFYEPAHQKLLARLASKGIAVIPLHQEFLRAADEEDFYDACHLSKTGYEKGGRFLLNYFIEAGLLQKSAAADAGL